MVKNKKAGGYVIIKKIQYRWLYVNFPKTDADIDPIQFRGQKRIRDTTKEGEH